MDIPEGWENAVTIKLRRKYRKERWAKKTPPPGNGHSGQHRNRPHYPTDKLTRVRVMVVGPTGKSRMEWR